TLRLRARECDRHVDVIKGKRESYRLKSALCRLDHLHGGECSVAALVFVSGSEEEAESK
ncbi:hypothetical protein BaRGS_00014841, partial [Batillaria attramentaria]